MASLLVCIKDDHNPDVYLDAKALKAGDVIAVCSNEHLWGKATLTDPRFRIVVFPSASIAAASILLTPELPVNPTTVPNPMLQSRGFGLKLDGISNTEFSAWLADDTRAMPAMTAPTQLDALIYKKPAIPDPNVIG